MVKMNGFKKLLIALIFLLFSTGLAVGGYFLGDLKEKQDRGTEERYIQMGDIRMVQQQLGFLSATLLRIETQLEQSNQSLDSVCMALNGMDTKLCILVEGY